MKPATETEILSLPSFLSFSFSLSLFLTLRVQSLPLSLSVSNFEVRLGPSEQWRLNSCRQQNCSAMWNPVPLKIDQVQFEQLKTQNLDEASLLFRVFLFIPKIMWKIHQKGNMQTKIFCTGTTRMKTGISEINGCDLLIRACYSSQCLIRTNVFQRWNRWNCKKTQDPATHKPDQHASFARQAVAESEWNLDKIVEKTDRSPWNGSKHKD